MESNSAAPDTLYRPMQRQSTGEPEDNFYDPMTTPEYDNARNQQSLPTAERQLTQEEEEWKAELAKLEQEIMTLRSVLSVKVQQAGDLKRKLGMGVITEMKQDLRQGLQSIKESDAYQKTNAAFRSFGNFASRKLGDVRNSNTFRSMEERIGGAYGTVKSKVTGSQSENNFEEALATSATNTSADTASTPSTPGTEKVPL